jgi:hypothetical protein
LKDVLDLFGLTDGRLLSITTDNASSDSMMTRELQSRLQTSVIEWPALRNHIPCMAHVIHMTLGAFMGSVGGKGRTKSWDAHEGEHQFRDNASRDIRKSQNLRKEGNARINKMWAIRAGYAKTIEEVRIS